MARKRRAPTVKQIATAALVKAVQAEKAARSAQRRIRKLEQAEVKERESVIGFRMPQDDEEAETVPEEVRR